MTRTSAETHPKTAPTSVDADTASDLDALSHSDFNLKVAALRDTHSVPPEIDVVRGAFESVADLEAFMIHAQDEDLVAGDLETVGSRARTARTARSKARAHKKARRKPTRTRPGPAPTARGPKRTKPGTRAAGPKLSSLVKPGRYSGGSGRVITWQHMPRQVNPAHAKFRRQRVGVGKCTGDKLKAVKRAFSNAYFLVETARMEVAEVRRSPDMMILWHASLKHRESSLSYWFGADYDPQQTRRMLTKIEDILSEWSKAFRSGFRGMLPVWIRCKSKNGVGGGPARHLVANTIELFPRYFNMTRSKRCVTMLHEMGHRSTALLTPRDERHDLCSGGWNKKENMCYRDPDEPDRGIGLFKGDNPRTLAIAAQGGSLSARNTALNNIDNFVCYMWNREIDRGGAMMRVLSAGAKPAGRPSGGQTSKPVN